MTDPVWVRGYYGERYVLVDGREVLDLHTEAEARRFLEELGEKALDTVDPRALPPGLRSDFEAAGSSREDTPARHFQATRGLDVDGDLGPITREAIIAEYMAIGGTTLPAGIEPIAHGCGENFPLEPDGGPATHAHDRRVELFFFDGERGIRSPDSFRPLRGRGASVRRSLQEDHRFKGV